MQTKCSIGAAVLAVALLLPLIAKAEDAKKYPDWDALWIRGSPVGAWDSANPPGRGQKPPLTPEYQAIWQGNLAKQAKGEGVNAFGGTWHVVTLKKTTTKDTPTTNAGTGGVSF